MIPAILLGKLSRWFIRIFRPGGGSALPGKLALKISPRLISAFRGQVRMGVIVVSGSAGKSTTTKLCKHILQEHGYEVFSNESTANIEQGLASALLERSTSLGKLDVDFWVLEVDEGHAAKLASALSPDVCVLTNLMTDQLDRFDDPAVVLEMLKTLANNSKSLIFNRDDPHLAQLAQGRVNAMSFSVASKLRKSPDYPELAPFFGEQKHSKPSDVEVSAVLSDSIKFKVGTSHVRANTKLRGIHNGLNIAASWLASVSALGQVFSSGTALKVIESVEPVFARDELVSIGSSRLRLVLVLNPGSFRMNLRQLGTPEAPIMIAIGTDVHDPSWLWSVPFEKLKRVDLLSGSNAPQLALWMSYQRIAVGDIQPNVPDAIDDFLKRIGNGTGIVVLSADAMRRLRRHLRLAK